MVGDIIADFEFEELFDKIGWILISYLSSFDLLTVFARG